MIQRCSSVRNIVKILSKMRICMFLSLTIAGIAGILSEDGFPTIYDKIDVDRILGSERISKQYANCLLDKGPCTADGRSLRRTLPEAIRTNCSSCNEKQKEIAIKLVNHFQKNKPDLWIEFCQKYDPEGVYMQEFTKFLLNN